MLSSIETLVTILNESCLTEDQKLSCIEDPKIWSIVHIMSVTYIQTFFWAYILLLKYFSPILYFFLNIDPPDSTYRTTNTSEILNVIRLIKQQVIVSLIYVTAAFLHTCFDSTTTIYNITYKIFIRWLIESLLIPYTLCFATVQYCLSDGEVFLDGHYLSNVFAIIAKLPLFIIMHCSEKNLALC